MCRHFKIAFHTLMFSLLLWCAPSASSAHLMPANRGTVNLVDGKAYMVVSLPVATFRPHVEGAAFEGDATTPGLLNAHRSAFREAVKREVTLTSQAEEAEFTTIMLSVPVGYGHDPERSEEIIIMATGAFALAPADIKLTSSLWTDDSDPLKIHLTVTKDGAVSKEEVGVLSADMPTHTFFASPEHVFTASLRSGFTHLVLGADHLIFLILVLVLAGTIRRRVTAMATFTAASAVAMSGGAMGWLNFPSQWVEVSIALSVLVVTMAHYVSELRARREAALIFVLGLCHGLGFMQSQELGTHLPIPKVAGFTLGMSLGVGAITCASLPILTVMERVLPDTWQARVRLGVTGLICMCGVWWTLQRASALPTF
jgi:hydrogenase/urease accessory protein HupE